MAQISAIERIPISGCSNGRGIKITATTSGGANTIHTATSSSGVIDEVWLYCYNSGSTNLVLYLCLGGTTDPDDIVKITIPTQTGDILVLSGECFNGGVVIKAYAEEANYLVVKGFVNRITNS